MVGSPPGRLHSVWCVLGQHSSDSNNTEPGADAPCCEHAQSPRWLPGLEAGTGAENSVMYWLDGPS